MNRFAFVLLLVVYVLGLGSCKDSQPAKGLTLSAEEVTRLQGMGDEYGMKQYAICTLNPGKKRLISVEEFKAIETADLNYLKSLSDAGTIVLLGFYSSGRTPNSFVIFSSPDTSAAKKVMLGSPKVAEGLVIPQFHTWYGPVALHKLSAIHELITTKKSQ